jgi:chemotaxis protein MotA
MNFSSMIDPSTLAIVLGGTVLATFLRAGWADWRAMLSQLGRALAGAFGMAKPFDAEALRGRIARELQGMQRDGLLRAEPRLVGDAEFDTAIRDMVTHRSTAGLKGLLEQLREKRLAPARAAVNTLGLSAELAPVFGLGGTLISLSRLPANGVDRTAYMSAIGMAVHATLYGLVLAHLLLAPLARLVERRMTHEDNARKALAQWLEAEVAEAAPGALTPAPKAAKPIRAVNAPHAVKPRCGRPVAPPLPAGRSGMSIRGGIGWQTMLADLSLILFMVTAAAMAEPTAPASKAQAAHPAPLRRRPSPRLIWLILPAPSLWPSGARRPAAPALPHGSPRSSPTAASA